MYLLPLAIHAKATIHELVGMKEHLLIIEKQRHLKKTNKELYLKLFSIDAYLCLLYMIYSGEERDHNPEYIGHYVCLTAHLQRNPGYSLKLLKLILLINMIELNKQND